jgi:hypothetical protein
MYIDEKINNLEKFFVTTEIERFYRDYDLKDIFQYGNLYNHCYKIMDDCKGRIDLKKNTVYYNPVFNEDGITFVHEMLHHHYIYNGYKEPCEEVIELMAENFYKVYPKLFDNYINARLNNEEDLFYNN